MTAPQPDNASSDFIPADVRQTIVAQALPKGQVGIVRLKTLRRNSGLTAPYELENSDLIVLQLRPFGEQDLWLDGRRAPFVPYGAGTVTIHDLDRNWVADLKGAFDCLHFHMPRPLLEETVDDIGGRQRPRLYLPPHLSAHDPIIHSLGQSLLPALARPGEASQIFIDHVGLAFQAHVAHRYGGVSERREKTYGKLTPSQARRAKELLLEHLDGNLGLADVASACGLSRSYFVKAFHQTTGLPPHRWLIVQRVERAKEWMLDPSLPLSTIADACGFADQSHFSRTFTRLTGVSPRRWRADNT
ncbi:helix-turn-helix domain-containing protein [Burkholderia contaminans]|uniref:AraC family transcriptional regulator n=1 Tax=Burkholderia contaminans TaxID=488447 RepID=A0A3N8QXT0_9BURK|nr:AraC family transcriptional regulator [Burkholderia contaminans]AKM44416.1 AraC family transcriptional regulator [Burkholderia contaminans]RQT28604.1 AraC family transcriptional regulator [Burkholderia contaminans]VWC61013.1 AraC family transcriptional regulator [Burkholderia contaminans]VWC99715.1 AraC family transcriptional regulator [Burkholderia contaminans]